MVTQYTISKSLSKLRKLKNDFSTDISTFIRTCQKISYGYELDDDEIILGEMIKNVLNYEFNDDYRLSVLIGKYEDADRMKKCRH